MKGIFFPKFTLFFALIAAWHLVSLAFFKDYIAVTKPLIMASLIGLYISVVQKQDHLFLLSLIFALMGDVFLLFEGELFFLMGLGAFFFMQLGYGFTFYKDAKGKRAPWFIITLLLVFASIILFILWPHVQPLRPFIIVYMASILAMVSLAFGRGKSSKSFLLVSIGALFFIVSDSLLALNKFVQALPFGHYVIMVTYILAQYAIVTGIADAHRTRQD